MSYAALRSYISKIHQVRYFMPPFAGTDEEVDALAAYIAGGLHGKEIVTVKAQGSGEQLFETNCAACHEAADLAPPLEGNSQEEISGLLATLDEISDEMVPFDGSEAEFEMLSRYLFSLNNGTGGGEAAVTGVAGEELFEINCSACHVAEDLAAVVSEWDSGEFRAALDKLETLSDEMPPYDGTAAEKDTLSQYIDKLTGEL